MNILPLCGEVDILIGSVDGFVIAPILAFNKEFLFGIRQLGDVPLVL